MNRYMKMHNVSLKAYPIEMAQRNLKLDKGV